MFEDKNVEPLRIRNSEISLHDTGLRKTSNFTPVVNTSAVDTFITAMKNGVSKIKHTNKGFTPLVKTISIAESVAINKNVLKMKHL